MCRWQPEHPSSTVSPLAAGIKQGVISHLAQGDSVNEAGELLWVMKEAHVVFSLLLALQTPILVFPLLVNTSACVRQELTPETPEMPSSLFCSTPSGAIPCAPGQDFQGSKSSLSWCLSSPSLTGMRICPWCWGGFGVIPGQCCHSPLV